MGCVERAPPAGVGGLCLRARFVVERREQRLSGRMRRECFGGKALNTSQEEFVQTLVSAR